MAKIELKQPIVKAIAEDVKDACAVVLVDHRGLTVEQDTVLRKKLREAGIDYKVRKNTMMNLAGKKRDTIPPDVAEYAKNDFISSALRTAIELDAGEEDWLLLVEELKKRKKQD